MTVIMYQDRDGDWRWTLKARNGKVLADSAEGYRKRAYCRRWITKIFPTLPVLVFGWDPLVARIENDG